MQPVSVKFDSRQQSGLAAVSETYGVPASRLIRTAVDFWLEAFGRAKDGDKAGMILRPTVKPRTRDSAKTVAAR